MKSIKVKLPEIYDHTKITPEGFINNWLESSLWANVGAERVRVIRQYVQQATAGFDTII